MSYRYDNFVLSERFERTPSGGIKIPATIARTGIQKYALPTGGFRREYRPEKEVNSPESLDSFRGAPLCASEKAEHPHEINSSNWARLARGHVGDDVRFEDGFVKASIYIQDQKTIDKIVDGSLKEISAGYSVKPVFEPGVTESGERYDSTQTEIRGNHVLLIPRGRGRAGSDVCLRLDAADNQIGDGMKIKIDGVEYSEVNDTLIQVVTQKLAALDQHQGRADAAESRVRTLETELAEAQDPKRLDSLITERANFVAQVKKIEPETRFDGRTEEEILREVCSKKHDLTGSESVDYLRGLIQGHTAVARGDTQKTVDVDPVKKQTRVRWTPPALSVNRGQA